MNELSIFKQNRIKNLQNIYKNSISQLYNILLINIAKYKLARFLSQNAKQSNITPFLISNAHFI